MRKGLWVALCASALVELGCSLLPPLQPLPSGLEERARAIGAEMAQIRDLALLSEVPSGVQPESELRESMRASIEKDWDARDDAVERAYKIMGLLPEQLDTKRYLIDFYTGQVAGYYDPDTKKFFLKADESASEREENFTIAHEFTHALQDQHFDLEAIRHSLEDSEDRTLAADALIEGDAMLGGIDHYAFRLGVPASAAVPLARLLIRTAVNTTMRGEPTSESGSAQIAQTPPVIARQIMFPYLEGALFADSVRAEFGQAGVDAVFRDLPESTEQVLYPERYLDRRDHPVQIRPVAPPAGWTPVVEQTLGMLSMQVLLREYLGPGAEKNAEGWDGDRYMLWKNPAGQEVLGWITVWDYPDQARRFAERYRRLLRVRRKDTGAAVLCRGDVVVAVEGSAEAGTLAERLLASELVRAPDDQPPLRAFGRALRWPLFVGKLDRVFETKLLGGHLFDLRVHGTGHRVSLLGGLLARSERTPDRVDASAFLGLVWKSSDRPHGYSAGALPPLFNYHSRSEGNGRGGKQIQSVMTLGWIPPLPPALALRRSPGVTEFSLLGRLGLRLTWGPATHKGEHLAVAFFRVPFL